MIGAVLFDDRLWKYTYIRTLGLSCFYSQWHYFLIIHIQGPGIEVQSLKLFPTNFEISTSNVD